MSGMGKNMPDRKSTGYSINPQKESDSTIIEIQFAK